ncbi:exopolysaccharide biosynthesis polyprenyl glycosylphosphotransferase [Sphingomonas ginkgonis]|uniref:exopolysaccharide biosynthesis polyprenyl glycosylphosphotransferase n=1 Tax=Sphingomonas ginkgonis TaxID=2315330 RepID=UPI00163AB290|nr:exopolysaccharide biosynthesis polyprenyl glycosylphosphotransferase [Sphingomonas ginkgonis]
MRLYALLMALDCACILASFAIAGGVRFGSVFVDGWAGVTASVTALFLLSAVSTGAYSLDVLRHPSRGVARAVGSVLLAFAMLFLLFFFLKVDQRLSRIMTGTSLLLATGAVTIVRQLVGDALRRRHHGQFTTEILLSDRSGIRERDGFLVVDAATERLTPTPSDAAAQIHFAEMLQGADRVVVACPADTAPQWSQMLKCTGIQGEVLSSDFDHLAPLGVSKVDGHTTLVVSSGPLNARQRLAKRALDLAISLPLLLFIAPVLLGIALAIKLESRGPVLFKQPRVGQGNTMFNILKFRSMRNERTDIHGNRSASRDDDRVTRVGRILRRTSLDELPQLLNVVLGSMSIVGPRPHALGSLAGDRLFWHVDERYWQRHAIKPGITGLAQVRGFRGATHTREHLTSRLQADLEYLSGWSIWRDISILVRTLRVVVHSEAY